jgi:hypothetical protein
LLAHADAVFNVAAATQLRAKENLKVGRLVYYGTDPVFDEVGFAIGDRIAAFELDSCLTDVDI